MDNTEVDLGVVADEVHAATDAIVKWVTTHSSLTCVHSTQPIFSHIHWPYQLTIPGLWAVTQSTLLVQLTFKVLYAKDAK